VSSSCEDTREVLPELALGIADGDDRARALAHVASCDDCRRELESLANVADELLLLAPEREPPPGFESRVLTQLKRHGAVRRGRPRWRRALVPIAAAAAAAALTAAILLNAFDDDRRIASRYRATLAQANGRYFTAARLLDRSGTRAGVVFGYEGKTPWVFVEVHGSRAHAGYRAELVMRSGRRVALRAFDLGDGGAGQVIGVALHDVVAVRMVDSHGEVLQATFPGRRSQR
jgi:anti-sigma factor RsiW